MTHRLEHILSNEGIRTTVLTTEVAPESREGWYDRQLRDGIQTVICHPKLVQTGLDLIEFPTIPSHIWEELTAPGQKVGKVIPATDGLIAATARRHGLHLMTRNTSTLSRRAQCILIPGARRILDAFISAYRPHI